MTLKEAKKELERLDNELDRLLKDKEIALIKAGYNSPSIKEVNVQSKKIEDRFLKYVIKIEKIDKEIELVYQQKENIDKWITNELKILEKYDDTVGLIIYMRDAEEKTWEEISKKVCFTTSWCRKLYLKHKKRVAD